MTHHQLKILLITSFSFLLGFAAACDPGLAIKIFRLDASQGALIRQQSGTRLEYKDADGYYCTSAADTKLWVLAFASCKKLCKQGSP